ncbi:MAG: BMP family ABC transporter substrate-binding protein [Spirochaetales bacterium]|nr:BMP family ABC transporter substrate-binding protein [Spirochaetales bacterium]
MKALRMTVVVAALLSLAVLPVLAGGTGEAQEGEGQLEVVAVMYGHANEGTWDPSAYQGLLKVQSKVGFDLKLSEGTSTQDAEKIIRNWAGRGVDVIFAHSDIYLDQVITVAEQFPKVHFICETQKNPDLMKDDPEVGKYSSDKTPANLVLSGDTPWEGNYMAGYVAAKMSKSGRVGILQPFEAPPLNRYTNSFVFGARAADPSVDLRVVYIGDYIAPAETRDAVNSLAQQGVDVIFSQMDDNAAILESAAQGIYCIPMYMDKGDVDPKTVLTSVVMDWSGPLGGAIEAVAKGNFEQYRKEWYFRPLSAKDGSIFLGKYGSDVPESLKKEVADIEKKFKSGALSVELVDEVILK